MTSKWNPLLRDQDLFAWDYAPPSLCHHSIAYRMGQGFAGDVGRFHPVTIEPARMSSTNPPLGLGLAVVIDPATMSVRQLAPGDTGLTEVYGITVRTYPMQPGIPPTGAWGQQPLGTSSYPPYDGAIDVLRMGYIMVPVVGTPRKGDPVFVWVAASGGGHVQGGFEAAASAGNTLAIGNVHTTFNSGPDAFGIAELAFNI